MVGLFPVTAVCTARKNKDTWAALVHAVMHVLDLIWVCTGEKLLL